MDLTISDILSLVIIGIFAGSTAGMILARKKEGFGRLANFGLGMIGAVIGDVIVRLFRIDFGLGKIVLRFEDLVAAFISCLIFFAARHFYKKKKKKKKIDQP